MRLKFCLIVILCLFFSSCSVPRINVLGPGEMSRDKVASAVLRTPSAALKELEFRDESDFLRIVTVDGEVPSTLDNRVVLAPGEHTVQIVIELRRTNIKNPKLVDVIRTDTSLTLEAKPDAEYLIDVKLTDLGLFIWIVEEFEGDIVAGRHPSGLTNIAKKSALDLD